MEESPYTIVEPTEPRVPLLVSVPHTGIGFPVELLDEFEPTMAAAPDDTDWYLDRLYDFAPTLGATMIVPKYSRWVIDLNREPSSKPLYDDGRIITALCPATDFSGTPIYTDKRTEVGPDEVASRLDSLFWPYHRKIVEILEGLISEFGIALFWDGHSIRRRVPTIQKEPFPDFILGDNDGKTAHPHFVAGALKSLRSQDFEVAHNVPFKGGFLTRSKGRPNERIHALQLEMSKDLYMSDDETKYNGKKAAPVKDHLRNVLSSLVGSLDEFDENHAI